MTHTATPEVAVKIISPKEVRQILDSNRPLQFWNVLTDEWFKAENIGGSRRVPLDKVGNEVRATNLPKNAEVVVYCGGPKCPQSRMAAENWPSWATTMSVPTRVDWKSGRLRA